MKTIPVRQISTEQRTSDFSESFSIRDVARLVAGKDIFQQLHRHDFFFVLALEKGSGRHEIDFNSFDIGNDIVFFIRPGQVHQLSLKTGSTGYLMQFSKDFYYPRDKASSMLLRKASSKNVCQMSIASSKRLLDALTYMFQECSEKQKGYQEVVKLLLAIFIIELVRNHQEQEGPSAGAHSYALERLDELSELLERNITTHKQVSQYAEMLHISSYQLNAITKAMLGKTCSALINDFIILESKRYLLATSNQVNQIADHLGYEDPSYFIRFFKKHTGFSPEAFRLNFR